MRRALFLVLAVVIAGGWRFLNVRYGWPGVELLTAMSFAAVIMVRSPAAALVPLAAAMTSDLVLGVSDVQVFTWSAWLGIGCVGRHLARDGRVGPWGSVRFAAFSSFSFYLWTNAGVWVLERGHFYSAGLGGLVDSWAAGLPFLRNSLVANLVVVPVVAYLAVQVDRRRAASEPAVPRFALAPQTVGTRMASPCPDAASLPHAGVRRAGQTWVPVRGAQEERRVTCPSRARSSPRCNSARTTWHSCSPTPSVRHV